MRIYIKNILFLISSLLIVSVSQHAFAKDYSPYYQLKIKKPSVEINLDALDELDENTDNYEDNSRKYKLNIPGHSTRLNKIKDRSMSELLKRRGRDKRTERSLILKPSRTRSKNRNQYRDEKYRNQSYKAPSYTPPYRPSHYRSSRRYSTPPYTTRYRSTYTPRYPRKYTSYTPSKYSSVRTLRRDSSHSYRPSYRPLYSRSYRPPSPYNRDIKNLVPAAVKTKSVEVKSKTEVLKSSVVNYKPILPLPKEKIKKPLKYSASIEGNNNIKKLNNNKDNKNVRAELISEPAFIKENKKIELAINYNKKPKVKLKLKPIITKRLKAPEFPIKSINKAVTYNNASNSNINNNAISSAPKSSLPHKTSIVSVKKSNKKSLKKPINPNSYRKIDTLARKAYNYKENKKVRTFLIPEPIFIKIDKKIQIASLDSKKTAIKLKSEPRITKKLKAPKLPINSIHSAVTYKDLSSSNVNEALYDASEPLKKNINKTNKQNLEKKAKKSSNKPQDNKNITKTLLDNDTAINSAKKINKEKVDLNKKTIIAKKIIASKPPIKKIVNNKVTPKINEALYETAAPLKKPILKKILRLTEKSHVAPAIKKEIKSAKNILIKKPLQPKINNLTSNTAVKSSRNIALKNLTVDPLKKPYTTKEPLTNLTALPFKNTKPEITNNLTVAPKMRPKIKPVNNINANITKPTKVRLAYNKKIPNISAKPIANKTTAPKPKKSKTIPVISEPLKIRSSKVSIPPIEGKNKKIALAIPSPTLPLIKEKSKAPVVNIPFEEEAKKELYSLAFKKGSSEISIKDKETLNALIKKMLLNKHLRLQIQAFAESTKSTQSDARRLSLSRGLMVRSYMTEKGIKPVRLDIRALGSKSEKSPLDRVDIIFMN